MKTRKIHEIRRWGKELSFKSNKLFNSILNWIIAIRVWTWGFSMAFFPNIAWRHLGIPYLEVKTSFWNAGDLSLIPGLGRSPGEGKWQPTPILLLGESHGGRSLVGYSPWGRKELDTTERLHFQFLILFESLTLWLFQNFLFWNCYFLSYFYIFG